MKTIDTECVLLVAPGGDPSPVAHLIWSMSEGLNTTKDNEEIIIKYKIKELHVILYNQSKYYFYKELEPQLKDLKIKTNSEINLQPHIMELNEEELSTQSGEDKLYQKIFEVSNILTKSIKNPIIFGLTGGSNRSINVFFASMFQILARRDDKILNTKISKKDLLMPGVFYFPKQNKQEICLDNKKFNADKIEIKLHEVQILKLRHLTDKDIKNKDYKEIFKHFQSLVEKFHDSIYYQKLLESESSSLEISIHKENISIKFNDKPLKKEFQKLSEKYIIYVFAAYASYKESGAILLSPTSEILNKINYVNNKLKEKTSKFKKKYKSKENILTDNFIEIITEFYEIANIKNMIKDKTKLLIDIENFTNLRKEAAEIEKTEVLEAMIKENEDKYEKFYSNIKQTISQYRNEFIENKVPTFKKEEKSTSASRKSPYKLNMTKPENIKFIFDNKNNM